MNVMLSAKFAEEIKHIQVLMLHVARTQIKPVLEILHIISLDVLFS